MSKVAAREGEWFAVPLRDDGFAAGIVARGNRRGVLLGYFFGPRLPSVPPLPEVSALTAEQAVLVGRFSDLRIRDGRWPLLGRSSPWDRRLWPSPAFIRYEELTGRTFHVYYDDADPHRVVRRAQVAPGIAEQGPTDGLMGAGFVEIRLTRLLSE